MINFIYLHRGSVLPVMHGVLILKRSDGFSVLCDEWLNDGLEHSEPEEKRYTMYELQMMHEKATGEQCFFIWDEGKRNARFEINHISAWILKIFFIGSAPGTLH